MSNFIIRQDGPSPVVADNLWEIRLGAGALLLGALAGGLGGVLVGRPLGRGGGPRGGGARGLAAWGAGLVCVRVGRHLGRRGKPDGGTRVPKDWPAKPVNIAHRG